MNEYQALINRVNFKCSLPNARFEIRVIKFGVRVKIRSFYSDPKYSKFGIFTLTPNFMTPNIRNFYSDPKYS